MPKNPLTKRIAAIDIGTITTRLLIADVSVSVSGCTSVEEVHRAMYITHLGRGVSAEGMLSDEGIAAVLSVLEEYVQTCESHCVDTVRCVATSAMRDARNADVLIHGAAKLGISVEVIGGAEEAQLAFVGATYDSTGAGDSADRVLVVDVGGGSTELILGQIGGIVDSSSAEIVQLDSLQLGSRRLTDAFIDTDPPSTEEVQAVREHARKLCTQYLSGYQHLDRVIAVAGTATTLAAVLGKVEPYDPEMIQGYKVTQADMDRLLKMFTKMTLSERQNITGLDPKRADVIIAGTIILQAVLNALDSDHFFTSDKDLLYGIVLGNMPIEGQKILSGSY